MKICIDARLVLNKVTGIGYYLTNLICTLAKIDDNNSYTIYLNKNLASSHPLKAIRKDTFSFEAVKIREAGPQQQFLMPFKLWSQDFDIYHYPHFDSPIIQNKPCIVTIHDIKYILNPSFFPEMGKIKIMYIEQMLRIAAKRARHIITVSESTKRSLVNYFQIPADKISTIWLAPPVSGENSNNSTGFQNSEKQSCASKKYFLFIGERRPHKNIVRMIEAFNFFLQRNGNNYRFLIIGPKYSDYSAPEDKIRDLSLEDKVKILGYISDKEKNCLLKNAELFLYPSLYEGFGIPILEAMAYGIPVITSNITSMPEVAGNAALLVNPENIDEIATAMEKVIFKPNLRNDIVRKGYKNIERFSWRKSTDQTLAVYREVYQNAKYDDQAHS